MRKLIALIILPLLASCTKEMVDYSNENGNSMIVFEVSAPDTRTSFGTLDQGTYPILWSNGDRIVVNGIESEPIEVSTSASSAQFVVKGTTTAPYNVVYPSEALNADGKVIVPATQSYTNGQFDPKAQIMLGQSNTNSVQLKVATAFVSVTINKGTSEEKLRSIKLYSYDSTPLSGVFTADYSAGPLSFTEDGRNYVTVTSTDGIEYTSGAVEAIFAVPAGEYKEGFAVAAVGTSSSSVYQMGRRVTSFTASHVTTLEAGKVYPLKAVTFEDDGLQFSGGKGTLESPYKIATAEDLMILSEVTNNGQKATYKDCHYIQMADIDMKGYTGYTPIANVPGSDFVDGFNGSYDGQGHIIENLDIVATQSYSGVFGFAGSATETASISHLTLRNCSIIASTSATGMLVGETFLADITDCRIESCSINGSSNYTGGIIGTNYYANLTDCTVDSETTVTSTGSYTGGAIGCNYPTASLTNSLTNVKVYATVSGVAHVGGIIGFQWTRKKLKTTLTNCEYEGVVTGTQYVGGILGSAYNTSYAADHTLIISNCRCVDPKSGIGTADATYVGGLVGAIISNVSGVDNTGLTVKIEKCETGCTVQGKTYVGGVVGCVHSGSNVSISETTSSSSVSGGFVGGIVGYVWGNLRSNETISNCEFSGELNTSSDSAGGIVGYILYDTSYTSTSSYKTNTYAHSTTISDCKVTSKGIDATGKIYIGGIVGRCLSYGSSNKTFVMTNCSSSTDVIGKGYCGGAIGQLYLIGPTNVAKLSYCKTTGDVSVTDYDAGGMIGQLSTKGNIGILSCSASGALSAASVIGGMVAIATVNDTSSSLSIVNCGYLGTSLACSGNYNNYSLIGGMIGWAQVTNGSMEVLNSFSRLNTITSPLNAKLCTAGIIGGTTGGTKTTCKLSIEGCYSRIPKSGFVIGGAAPSDELSWGGIVGSTASFTNGTVTVNDCYWEPTARLSLSNLTGTNLSAYTTPEALLTTMNSFVQSYSGSAVLKLWVADDDTYPVIIGMTSTSVEPKWRVSVIGDSISTFFGYIPSDYAFYYPRTNTDTGVSVTSVTQTYWYKFIYNYLSNARFEKNIAYSGSRVSSTHSTPVGFIQRFRDRKMGDTNLIILHGGRNDYGSGKLDLAEGYNMDTLPPDSVFNQIFAQADTDLESLSEVLYIPAYVKLVKLIKQEYPDARILCIIGDCLNSAYEQAMIKISNHFADQGMRYVDFMVNGFNDTVNIPKVTGSHPNEKGAEYMASKMYEAFGEWLK